MAQRQYRTSAASGSGNGKVFPPEADGQFDVVPEARIVEWREKLNARYGIGKGRLRVTAEPAHPAHAE